MPTFKFEMTVDLPNGEEREFEFSGTMNPYVPGYLSGPPEKCYPNEGGDIEDLEVSESGSSDTEDFDTWASKMGFSEAEADKLLGHVTNTAAELEDHRAAEPDDRDEPDDREED